MEKKIHACECKGENAGTWRECGAGKIYACDVCHGYAPFSEAKLTMGILSEIHAAAIAACAEEVAEGLLFGMMTDSGFAVSEADNEGWAMSRNPDSGREVTFHHEAGYLAAEIFYHHDMPAAPVACNLPPYDTIVKANREAALTEAVKLVLALDDERSEGDWAKDTVWLLPMTRRQLERALAR